MPNDSSQHGALLRADDDLERSTPWIWRFQAALCEEMLWRALRYVKWGSRREKLHAIYFFCRFVFKGNVVFLCLIICVKPTYDYSTVHYRALTASDEETPSCFVCHWKYHHRKRWCRVKNRNDGFVFDATASQNIAIASALLAFHVQKIRFSKF